MNSTSTDRRVSCSLSIEVGAGDGQVGCSVTAEARSGVIRQQASEQAEGRGRCLAVATANVVDGLPTAEAKISFEEREGPTAAG